jgi:hypothetical protein
MLSYVQVVLTYLFLVVPDQVSVNCGSPVSHPEAWEYCLETVLSGAVCCTSVPVCCTLVSGFIQVALVVTA